MKMKNQAATNKVDQPMEQLRHMAEQVRGHSEEIVEFVKSRVDEIVGQEIGPADEEEKVQADLSNQSVTTYVLECLNQASTSLAKIRCEVERL